MKHRPSEKGAALLSVLLIVSALAVAALIATTAIARQTDLARTASWRSDASWAAHSAESLARSAIQDLTSSTQGQVTPLTPGLRETVSVPARGGVLTLTVRDATNCININTLASSEDNVSANARLAWVHLLQDVDVPGQDAATLTNTLSDWVDADSNQRTGGAEDGYYLSLRPPYRAANQPMSSPRELAAVLGYSKELIATLSPMVCALPGTEQHPLNINTLTPEEAPLLRALYSDALSLQAAERLISRRPETGWNDVASFESQPDIRVIQPGARRTGNLSITSNLFLAEGRVQYEGMGVPFSFLIYTGQGQVPAVIWRRMGEE